MSIIDLKSGSKVFGQPFFFFFFFFFYSSIHPFTALELWSYLSIVSWNHYLKPLSQKWNSPLPPHFNVALDSEVSASMVWINTENGINRLEWSNTVGSHCSFVHVTGADPGFFKRGGTQLRTDRTLAPVGTGGVWGGCASSEAEKICHFQS